MDKGDNAETSNSVVQNIVEQYIDSEEEPLKAPSDDENAMEPIVTEVQEKYNKLQERFVTLKTMTESLKEKLVSEKQNWSKEVEATIQMQTKMRRNSHMCGDRYGISSTEEYVKKMQLFRDFMIFQQTTENLQSVLRKKNYQNWLTEIENKCSLELLKIQENMINLKPLQDMASTWTKQPTKENTCMADASGDRLKDQTQEDEQTETASHEDINMLELNQN